MRLHIRVFQSIVNYYMLKKYELLYLVFVGTYSVLIQILVKKICSLFESNILFKLSINKSLSGTVFIFRLG